MNRVQNQFLDQTVISGHENRPSDLDLLASTGVSAVRYPVLWERTFDPETGSLDWRFADQRLNRLRSLGIKPIVGLLHHGSGPRHTNLLDEKFASGLAEFARHVAERYPWVDAYTPVNEPMTTSRFSCLYGHWYPHTKDSPKWIRALMNQVKANSLSMRAIREVNPSARLIQTDDLGKTSSDSSLAYQAELENERRWLGWDLAAGRVTRDHPLWQYLVDFDAPLSELEWFIDNPCPPDVVGVNYYPSSERFLDHRVELYAPEVIGGNGRDRYADGLTGRICMDGMFGPTTLLLEAWNRYKIPVAITECHNAGFREEQVRWLLEVWNGVRDALAAGAQVEAVTVWAFMGSYDWDLLVTSPRGYYEPGPYDLRSPSPRPTALRKVMKSLSAGSEPDLPVLDAPGWWRREDRFEVEPLAVPDKTGRTLSHGSLAQSPATIGVRPPAGRRKILILGVDTPLGREVEAACHLRALDCLAPDRDANFELEDGMWAVIDARLSSSPEREMLQMRSMEEVASACQGRRIPLVLFSSYRVFSSTPDALYGEGDRPTGDTMVAASLRRTERIALETCSKTLVVRSGELFGTCEASDPLKHVLNALKRKSAGQSQTEVLSPTYVVDLVNQTIELLIDGEVGVWHLVNLTEGDSAGFARGVELASGSTPGNGELAGLLPSVRPVLKSDRAWIMPSVSDAVCRATRALIDRDQSRVTGGRTGANSTAGAAVSSASV